MHSRCASQVKNAFPKPTQHAHMIGRICWYTFILVTFGWFNNAGFYITTTAQNEVVCAICPVGLYCNMGLKQQCMGGDITYALGKQSIYDCQPNSTVVQNNVAVSLLYTQTTPTKNAASVNELMSLMSTYMIYTAPSTCILTTDDNTYSGTVSCYATIGPSIMGMYIVWLQQQMQSQQIAAVLEAAVARAVQQASVNLVSVSVHPAGKPPVAIDTSLLQAGAAPLLSVGLRRWGATQGDLFQALFCVVVILVISSCMCLMGLMVFASRYRHGTTLHKKMMVIQKRHDKISGLLY